jgi:sugar phosphate isomerase/epimerase
MSAPHTLSRRAFLAAAASAPLIPALAQGKDVTIGLELYSVRNELKQDLPGTVRAVAKMGYECVEFFSPYFQWTVDDAKKVRTLLDELRIRCLSTHNDAKSFTPENLPHAIELNQIIGSKFVVMASSAKVVNIDGWKTVADTLNQASEKLKPIGMRAGYHNHLVEFRPMDGQLPMEVLAANTTKDVMLQFDTGPCLEAGVDPVKWIKQNPGRIRSMHLKDWSHDAGYKAIFGEGEAPWQQILTAAEKTGGIEFYLLEQEGSAYPPLETAERCLAAFRKLRPA